MITDRAMLVRLSISVWAAKKGDRRANRAVENAFGIVDANKAGNYTKWLVGQESIQRLTKLTTEIRTWHYQNTLPWTDDGARLLPTANFADYSAKMRAYHQQFDAEVQTFIRNYPDIVAEARIRLNGLFNPADYPSNITERFGWGIEVSPVPQARDFRVDLAADEVAANPGRYRIADHERTPESALGLVPAANRSRGTHGRQAGDQRCNLSGLTCRKRRGPCSTTAKARRDGRQAA